MKRLFSTITVVIVLDLALGAQEIKTLTVKTLTDSFTYSEVDSRRKFGFRDTIAFGTSYYLNVFGVSTEIDSVKVGYDVKQRPNKQVTCIKVKSPEKEQVLYVNFNECNCWFTDDYIKTVTGQANYSIPETYELANVLYTLTNSSQLNTNRTYKGTNYYNEVMTYFRKFKDHPLLKELEFSDDAKGVEAYYNFRDNSICFSVYKGRIIANDQYYAVWGRVKDNLFARHLSLINDFYKKSHFHSFYTRRQKFYDSLVARQQTYMPARKMQTWLESEFDRKFNSYRIVFSPLIWGSHGTQSFYWVSAPRQWFSQMIMFVSGDRGVANDPLLNENQKEGIASGILFTEIDHNYCNPVSFKYSKEIDTAFSQREKWVTKGGDSDNYPSAMNIFNEYITHAVYILYANDNFTKNDFDVIRKTREELMIKQRRYIKFREFTDALLHLYLTRKAGHTIMDLYPGIIRWCATNSL